MTADTGYVLVPLEATSNMHEAAEFAADGISDAERASEARWAAMLAARPPVGEEVVEAMADAMMAVTPQPLTRIVAKMYARAIIAMLEGR